MKLKDFLKEFDNLKPKKIGKEYNGTDFTIEYDSDKVVYRDREETRFYGITMEFSWGKCTKLFAEYEIKDDDFCYVIKGANEYGKTLLDNLFSFKEDSSYHILMMNIKRLEADIKKSLLFPSLDGFNRCFNSKAEINGDRITIKCAEWRLEYINGAFFTSDGNNHYIKFEDDKHQAENVQSNGDFDLFENGMKKSHHNIFKEEDLFYLKMIEII